MKRILAFLLAATALLALAGCASTGQSQSGNDTQGKGAEDGYTQISQERAKEMMAEDDGHVVVDVRRQDEYNAGHIPGAILIPNESISTDQPAELPDLDQVILVYCRSGNRSKTASQVLVDLGYTSVYEFGSINDWPYEIEK